MTWGGEAALPNPNPANAFCCGWFCSEGDEPNAFVGAGCVVLRFPKMETRSSSGFDEVPAIRFAAAGTVVEISVAANPDG